MSDLIRPKRSLLTGVAPGAVAVSAFGELSVNLTDRKIFVAGDDGSQHLVSQRIEEYSAVRKYAVGDLCVSSLVLYRCIVAVDPVGVFDPAKWEAIGGGSGGTPVPAGYVFVRRVWFLTIGTFTYDVPADVDAVRFNVHAPGGPGGGVPAMSSNCGAAAGGSGGGFSQKWVDDPVQLSKQFTFVLPDGAAGLVGANGPISPNATLRNTAVAGGTIELNVSGGNSTGGASLMNPGTAPNSVVGGTCGVPTGGDINLAGQPGEPGYRGSASEIMAGRGGGAVFGGAPGFAHKGNAVGKDGSFGAGGSGAASTVSAFAGGKGGQAFAWVDEFASIEAIVSGMVGAEFVGFSVHRNGVTQALGVNIVTTILWTHEAYDEGGYFDVATSRYTPPAGWYHFNLSVFPAATGTDNNAWTGGIRKNGTENLGEGLCRFTQSGQSAHANALVYLNGTDYVDSWVAAQDGTDLNGAASYTKFSGFKIPVSGVSGGAGGSLDDLSDVVLTTPAAGDMLRFNGAGILVNEKSPYTVLGNRVSGVLTTSKTLLDVNVPEAVSFADGLPGSIVVGLVAATAITDFAVIVGAVAVATIRVAAGQLIGVGVAGGGVVNVPAQARLRVVGPASPDATFADVSVALKLTRD